MTLLFRCVYLEPRLLGAGSALVRVLEEGRQSDAVVAARPSHSAEARYNRHMAGGPAAQGAIGSRIVVTELLEGLAFVRRTPTVTLPTAARPSAARPVVLPPTVVRLRLRTTSNADMHGTRRGHSGR